MTDISESIRWNLIEQFIIAQPSWGSGGAASPQVGPEQHPGEGRGSEAPETLEIERILTSCLYFFLTTK